MGCCRDAGQRQRMIDRAEVCEFTEPRASGAASGAANVGVTVRTPDTSKIQVGGVRRPTPQNFGLLCDL